MNTNLKPMRLKWNHAEAPGAHGLGVARRLRKTLASFLRCDSGATAIVFALTFIPITIAVGIAIDLSQAMIVKERLSQAIDAAALASGATANMSAEDRDQYIMDYIAANYPDGDIGNITSIEATVIDDDKVTITATAEVETAVLSIIGYDVLAVNSRTEVLRDITGLELVMVLDNTGSMSGSKIADLKDAAGELVDILHGEGAGADTLKIGLVPFSAAVNIGTEALDEGWMDEAGAAPIATSKFNFDPGQTVWDLYDAIPNRSWNGCVEARLPPYDTTDDPPTSPETRWQPYFAPDESDQSGYDNDYFSDGVPLPADTETRQKSVVKYDGTSVSSSSKGPLYGCTVDPITPLTNSKSTVTNAINDMGADGYTHIPLGLVWGWRAISPAAPFTEGAAYTDPDWEKAIVLLTDGENTIDSESNDNKSNYSAYGHLAEGRLGTTSANTFENKLDDNTALLCQRIKNAGVRVYTITFQVDTDNVRDLMQDCASEVGLYFDSPSSSELNAAFQAIARDLNNLRISQ